MDGFRIAANAIKVVGTSLDVTANNLANVNTAGFRSHSTQLGTGPGGRGVDISSITETQNPGPVVFSGRSLDLSVSGNQFFAVRQAGGRLAFTRDGSFQIDARGRVATSGGDLLDPPLTVPRDAQQIGVSRDGVVTAALPDGSSAVVGEIRPVTFANPQGLARVGDNLFVPTPASGPGQRADAGEILQGTVELSNTDIATEMVNLIQNERMTGLNVAVLRTEDEIQGTILDLKR